MYEGEPMFDELDLSALSEEYLDRVDASFRGVSHKDLAQTCNALASQLLKLPAGFLLEDLPGLAVVYHRQIRTVQNVQQISKAILPSHRSLMKHLGWDNQTEKRWLRFVAELQEESDIPRISEADDEVETTNPLDALFDAIEDDHGE